MKKLKVTVGELYNIEQSILAADVMKMMFSRKGSLCLLRNMKKMESELEEFKSKRTELIKEYSNGNDSISPESERWSEFVTAYNELASVEASVEINTIALKLVSLKVRKTVLIELTVKYEGMKYHIWY